MKTLKFLTFIFFTALLFTFCKKDKDPEPVKATPYFVRMTDAPAPYTAVNIDLQSIEITGGGSSFMINTTPGIYNLLNFANGIDTLIATGNLTIDKVEQIRFILGPNNSVVTGGQTYPMTVPSGSESGLKLQVHQTLEPGVAYYVLLDFDANQSVVQNGNGSYHLKPVIRTIETALSGAIKGQLSVPNVPAVITASSSTNVFYSTAPVANGEFIIKGLPAGTYSLSVVPTGTYSSSTMTNVQVTVGVTTTVGVIAI